MFVWTPEICTESFCVLQLSGTVPAFIADVKTLQEVELRNNRVRFYSRIPGCILIT